MGNRIRSARRLAAFTAGVIAFRAAIGASAWHAVAPTNDPSWGQAQFSKLNIMGGLNSLDHPLAGVPVASIDTGVDLQHPDLAPRLFSFPAGAPPAPAGNPGWNFMGPGCFLDPGAEQPNGNPDDPLGCGAHGTTVSSMMGAQWSNGSGGAGIAPNARLMAIKACWEGDLCWGHTVPPATQLAVDGGARVVTFSFVEADEVAMNPIISANQQTLFVAIPSGNGGDGDIGTGVYPCNAAYVNVVCVTTAGLDDGVTCGGYNATIVDIAGPTARTVGSNGGPHPNGYSPTGCATSYASPTLGGIAAILFGEYPNATAGEVRDAILLGDRDVGAWTGKTTSGGIPDLQGALAQLKAIRPAGESPGGGPGAGPGGTTEPFPPNLSAGPPAKKKCKKVKPKKGKKKKAK